MLSTGFLQMCEDRQAEVGVSEVSTSSMMTHGPVESVFRGSWKVGELLMHCF